MSTRRRPWERLAGEEGTATRYSDAMMILEGAKDPNEQGTGLLGSTPVNHPNPEKLAELFWPSLLVPEKRYDSRTRAPP